jgi:acyl-coenzyme A synthetase/AMP-(fatty) acid ligase
VRKGDAIDVSMPMGPECVIAMLAITKIGGIFRATASIGAARASTC